MSAEKPARLLPRLRFPEFRDALGWPRCLMGRYLSESRIRGSGGHEAKKITVKLWGKGVIEKHESMQGSVNTQYYRRRAGQFIYSKLDFLNQAFGIVPEYLDGFESTADLPCFDIVPELDAKFLLEYVLREQFYKTHGEIADGSRKAKRIQVETFLECPIYVPSKPEQQKIADCLGSLDDLIAAESRKLEALRQHKQGLMQQLFPQEGETVPRLRFPEFCNAGEWETRGLEKLVSIQSGSTPSKANPAFWDGSIPWASAKDMKRLLLDDTEDHISIAAVDDGTKLVPAGTLLILTRGMTLLKDVPICVSLREMSFNQDVKALRPKTDVNSLFLAFALLGSKQRLLKMVDISGHGTGKLNTDELEAFELAFPRPAEQHRIAVCLSSLDEMLATQSRKVEGLAAHKRGLLQQLFPSLGEDEA